MNQNMRKERMIILWEQYLAGRMSRAEKQELQELSHDPALQAHFEELVNASVEAYMPAGESHTDKTLHFEKVMAAASRNETGASIRRLPSMRRWWVAASMLFLLGSGLYFFLQHNKRNKPLVARSSTGTDLLPGRNGAILTLADGSQVELDSFKNGTVASQNGAQVVLANGQLSYDVTGNASTEIAYNSIHTPRGRQFHVQLPDGTGVWLNAASSIRYPTRFTGAERKVDITGEAYLEVTKDTKMPFFVNVNNQATVEVLGTHFNINAYENEGSLAATLLEGAVRVSKGAERVMLRPEQQAKIAQRITVENNISIDKVMAWKNGYFYFDHQDISSIMRQVQRWYDVEVVYESVPEKTFSGTIPRNVKASQLLKMLELTENVKFTIDNNKIIVRR
jgi:ferric-dicitrate binding protein FerR (iron transport regulator)